MSNDRKNDWKCHKCRLPRERRNSTNDLYQTVIYNEATKQRKDEKEISDGNKRFKPEQTASTAKNLKYTKSDNDDMKGDIREIRDSMSKLVASLNTVSAQFQTAIECMNKNLSGLTHKVNELQIQNIDQDKRLLGMDTNINKLEQGIMKNNIEISNVNNKEISAMQTIKNIVREAN